LGLFRKSGDIPSLGKDFVPTINRPPL